MKSNLLNEIVNILNWVAVGFIAVLDFILVKNTGVNGLSFIAMNFISGWFLCSELRTALKKLAEITYLEAKKMQNEAHSIVNDCSVITRNVESEIVRLLQEGHIIVNPEKKEEFKKLQSNLDSMNSILNKLSATK